MEDEKIAFTIRYCNKAGNEVMVSDFLGLCDERVYNMDSKQNDIKYMKRLDFAGLYYIKNITKRKCYEKKMLRGSS